ncbi:MAG TPA: hypothetical protein ENH29_01440 [Bacteroidetes bacterium]|nr:hypothetical protein [Bacteroidota bacterium]
MIFRLKIKYYSKYPYRFRNVAALFRSLVISIFLLTATGIFFYRQLLPLWHEKIEISRSLVQQEESIQEAQDRLRTIKLEGPFARQWRPRQYLRYANICPTDTLAYQRLALINGNLHVTIKKMTIKKREKDLAGFDFGFEIVGRYMDLVAYWENLENNFSCFQIKNVKIWPESAENKYKGLLCLKMNGWLW